MTDVDRMSAGRSDHSRRTFLCGLAGGAAATWIGSSCGSRSSGISLPPAAVGPIDTTQPGTAGDQDASAGSGSADTILPTAIQSDPNELNVGAAIEGIGGPETRRGVHVQVTDTVPPPSRPRNWIDGAFISSVGLPRGVDGFAFTLDDGPSPYNTDVILRSLETYGIHATFFLIGSNVRAWPEIARRIRDAGHEIGNHSVYHSPYASAPLASQIGPNQAIIQEATGLLPVANRAPGLTRGQTILDTCAGLGMYELHTTLNQDDWRSPRWSVASLVAEAGREYDQGTFSLNHDGGGPRPTASGWTALMDVALGKGLIPTTATELITMGVPQPGGRSYSQAASRSNFPQSEDYVLNTCNYDPELELKTRLDDPTTRRAERSRIVEVLADIDDHKRSG